VAIAQVVNIDPGTRPSTVTVSVTSAGEHGRLDFLYSFPDRGSVNENEANALCELPAFLTESGQQRDRLGIYSGLPSSSIMHLGDTPIFNILMSRPFEMSLAPLPPSRHFTRLTA
jgi:hypothetical protein